MEMKLVEDLYDDISLLKQSIKDQFDEKVSTIDLELQLEEIYSIARCSEIILGSHFRGNIGATSIISGTLSIDNLLFIKDMAGTKSAQLLTFIVGVLLGSNKVHSIERIVQPQKFSVALNIDLKVDQ
jgi:hypothetical protein